MTSAKRRLDVLKTHLESKNKVECTPQGSLNWTSTSKPSVSASNRKSNKNSIPRKRQHVLKWNGWGYNDSKFIVHKGNNYYISFTGQRYKIGNLVLPYFASWVQETLGVDFSDCIPARDMPPKEHFPEPLINKELLSALESLSIEHSADVDDRLFRSHGHTLAEIFHLREGPFDRLPDLVVWPESHSQVESIVQLCCKYNVVVIPFGGGTSVTGGVLCPSKEERMVISLDTSQMSRILWVNEENLTACIESGIIGQDLEKQLQERGFITGHEPDSFEFSSLGGWVATRASGMKKNTYGNIEDIVVSMRTVTPSGIVQRFSNGPRVSAGPDVNHFILGSEGSLGVVTEVTLKIQPAPPIRRYGSLVFEDFQSGLKCMREVALRRCQPSSIRLIDNDQFKFGHALKPPTSLFGLLTDGIKKVYITKFKGLDVNKMCVATLLFEGSEALVKDQERHIYELSYKFGGIPAGEANGERGYMLTFVIAYIRDLGFDYGVVAESFETSVPWDCVANVCTNVKHRVKKECDAYGIKHKFVTCRVTQTYDAGACIYFYFAFNYRGINNPVLVYEEIENSARAEIISNGGTISHHHGVGKIRRGFMSDTLTPSGLGAIKALKDYFDPDNIFACGNLI